MAKPYKELVARTRLGHVSQLARQAYNYAEMGRWDAAETELARLLLKVDQLAEDLGVLAARDRGEKASMVEEAEAVGEAVPEP